MPDLGLLTWEKTIVHGVTEELSCALMKRASECDPSMQRFLSEEDIEWLQELADNAQDEPTRQQAQQIIAALDERKYFSVELA